ncbi:MAG: hypothetical protein A4E34_01201 [Methanoregula sp. PtaU1.Bin006]|nr:MAG: hypothetical protein A4E33_00946 [Methanoregula sp. PtaB.Bin085]OPY34965.1 MAG: hypothetical protein A4E34_01201 [Methanoregula sp. PtaU1.Bin006]
MRLNNVVPSNNLVNRTEPDNFPFNLPEEPFNLPISLWMFYPCDDVFDSVLIQELSKRVSGVLPVPGRNKLSSMICQDLAGSSILSKALIKDGDGVLSSG